jgi:diguanylate cyclase (GGDEF)-like protein
VVHARSISTSLRAGSRRRPSLHHQVSGISARPYAGEGPFDFPLGFARGFGNNWQVRTTRVMADRRVRPHESWFSVEPRRTLTGWFTHRDNWSTAVLSHPNMNTWNHGSLRSLIWPGGVLLLAAGVVLQAGVATVSDSSVNFYYYAVFVAGILLAWRFHSSRVLFTLLTLPLAQRAMEFFGGGKIAATGPGRIVFEAVAFLLPLNFIVLSWARERGFAVPALAQRLGLLFFESVFVAVICRPGEKVGPAFLRVELLSRQMFGWTGIPQVAWLALLVALGILLGRFLLYRKPVESGLVWSLAAAFLGLQAGGVGRIASGYFATAGLVLVSSIVETSYLLAYHDELTTLPARRAFNEALLRLEGTYAVAMVDIDHFKSFNDTYGHDTGDQVLRLVAGRLARVSGGGEAYRVGGEEFTILFPGKTVKEVVAHLEMLRRAIEESKFRVRGVPERRGVSRGADRRLPSRKGAVRKLAREPIASGELSVTVSIGVAESSAMTREVEQVIQAADKALYRAKQNGRNRVETAGAGRMRGPRMRRSIA